jgi:ADP-ribose pyrophosphatase YjhB (NUDIX family)
MQEHRNPLCTVDAIIEIREYEDLPPQGIILIKRRNPPFGWAIPGGFVDYGESLQDAVKREMKEETGLEIEILRQFHTYSDPKRDPRHHTITTVYLAQASGEPKAGDDAGDIGIFRKDTLPEEIAFDHRQILEDYFTGKF